ncbi:hypothetical protein COY07_04115 [Candidatus Peregrinibacteria bacterium CG_4_10_14_0_2_um_filter_43_11]|nr:MAG: hypothetical protein COY07_04115 [Candidatus Peregrinibacteria bacterium CG_4_10_14_0_2_um_filter_43_11]
MIKKATLKDLNSLAALNREVQQIHHDAFPGIFKPYSKTQVLKSFKQLLKNKKITILISFNHLNSPVGYIFYEEKKHLKTVFTQSHNVLYIHHIAIKANLQKKGAGSDLIKEVIKRAETRNICRIELDVWSFNSKAKNFFRKNGFNVFNEKMALDLK